MDTAPLGGETLWGVNRPWALKAGGGLGREKEDLQQADGGRRCAQGYLRLYVCRVKPCRAGSGRRDDCKQGVGWIEPRTQLTEF